MINEIERLYAEITERLRAIDYERACVVQLLARLHDIMQESKP